jgi:hypothetical protein
MQIGRNVGKSGEHYATKLVLRDRGKDSAHLSDCVFDWWSTLKTDAPLVFSSALDFTKATGGVPFSHFAVA